MDQQSNLGNADVVLEVGSAVLVTCGFGLALTFASSGLLLISTAVSAAVFLRTTDGLAGLLFQATALLCEIVIFALAFGVLAFGVGLFLRGLSEAITSSGLALRGLSAKYASHLRRLAAILIRGPVDLLRKKVGTRGRQLILLLFLGLAPPLLAIAGRSTGRFSQPLGMALIKRALPTSIYLFEGGGIALAIALGCGLFMLRQNRLPKQGSSPTAHRKM